MVSSTRQTAIRKTSTWKTSARETSARTTVVPSPLAVTSSSIAVASSELLVQASEWRSPLRVGNTERSERTLPFAVRPDRLAPFFHTVIVVRRSVVSQSAAGVRVDAGAKVRDRRCGGQHNRCMLTDRLSADRIVAVRARQRQPIRCGRDRCADRQ